VKRKGHDLQRTRRGRFIKRRLRLATLDCKSRRVEARMRSMENRHRRVLGLNFDA
jgi:hypothetical protein